MKKIIFGAAFAALCLSSPAYANLSVFACEPEWGALSTEIGGDKVSVYTATTGQQDPHQIQARPSLIAKARGADITVCDGAELEIGWLPMILQQANNAKIQPRPAGRVRSHQVSCPAGTAHRAMTARWATSMPRAIRISRPIRA